MHAVVFMQPVHFTTNKNEEMLLVKYS